MLFGMVTVTLWLLATMMKTVNIMEIRFYYIILCLLERKKLYIFTITEIFIWSFHNMVFRIRCPISI